MYSDKVYLKDENIPEVVQLSDTYGLSTSDLFYEFNIVPAEDSPNNILNKLNNDCIQMILRKLCNVQDYLNAAEVCTQFESNAIAAFPEKFKKLCIDYDLNDEVKEINLCLECAKRFISIFGSLLDGIAWNGEKNQENDNDFFNMIAHYCGNTLKKIMIEDINVDFNTQVPFSTLQNITIKDCKIINFPPYTELRNLRLVMPVNMEILQYFPKIEKIFFENILPTNHVYELIKFVDINPHLNDLTLNNVNIHSSRIEDYFQHCAFLMVELERLAAEYYHIYGEHWNA